MQKVAYVIGCIGLIMILLGILSLAAKYYIDSECEKTTNISWWVANCDYKK